MDVGSRIRRLRLAKRLRLVDLSEEVGLSVSYLSQIENGKANISIATLKVILNALDTNVAEFFHQSVTGDYHIVRHHQQKYYKGANGVEEALLQNQENFPFETCIIKIPPYGDIGHRSSHQGYEFTFVIAGKVTISLDNESFVLEEGDIIFYKSILSHTWKNEGEKEAVLLVTNTPKTF